MDWVANDGGRKAAGFCGTAGDCVTRAIAIVTGKPYREVYDTVNQMAREERHSRSRKTMMAVATGRGSAARTGVMKDTWNRTMAAYGFHWVPTMKIGQGCTVHLRANELPAGRIVVKCSGHAVAVIDGVIHDTHDPSRGGSRCVYGYWALSTPTEEGETNG